MREVIAAAACFTLLAAPAFADPQSISTNVPIQVEDAYPTPYGVMTLQSDIRYTNDSYNSRGATGIATEGVIKVDPLPGLQIDLSPAIISATK